MNAHKELIEMLEGQKKELENELSICCITSTPYIIRCGQVYTIPKFDNRVSTGEVQATACPLRATRFSKKGAEKVAASIRNKAGDRGEVVGFIDAVEHELDKINDILAKIK